jgi:type IV pilus assembly protein PilW
MQYPMRQEGEEKGFTLIELLLAMALSAIVLAALVGTFVVQRRTYVLQEQITEMVQTARAAVDMMSREIRMAGYNPKGGSFQGIPYHATQLRIRADLRGDGTNDPPDGDTNDPNEDITYKYYDVTHQIKRKTGKGYFQPFAENIQAFSILHLDGEGNPTASTADIRQIGITVTARTERPDPHHSANGGFRTYTLTSLITPTNLAF